MNESYQPFDPSLKPIYSEQLYAAALQYQPDSRHLFYSLMHCSEHYAVLPLVYEFIKHQLQDVTQQPIGAFFKDYDPDKIDRLFEVDVDIPTYGATALEDCLQQCAPIVLTEPCWLQAVSQAATCQMPLTVELMTVYLSLTQGESYKNIYLALMLAAGNELPAIHTQAFAEQKAVSDCVYDFAVTQLALAAFPRILFPEILGFTLAYSQKPALMEYFESIANTPQNSILAHFISLRNQRSASQILPIIDVIRGIYSFLSNKVMQSGNAFKPAIGSIRLIIGVVNSNNNGNRLITCRLTRQWLTYCGKKRQLLLDITEKSGSMTNPWMTGLLNSRSIAIASWRH